jgi:hypothetical protein
MAVSVAASGSIAATVVTEHTLTTLAGPGVYQFEVDASVLAAQDVLELRVKGPTLSGGTARVLFYTAYYGVQATDDVMKVSVPFAVDSVAGNHVCTLLQVAGTSRTFPWKITTLG